MPSTEYTADLAEYEAFGGGNGNPLNPKGAGHHMALHVWPIVAATLPGAGLQVTVRWDDGFGGLQDDTIISLDMANSGVFKLVPMWIGFNAIGTIEATMFNGAGATYGIDWQLWPDLVEI